MAEEQVKELSDITYVYTWGRKYFCGQSQDERTSHASIVDLWSPNPKNVAAPRVLEYFDDKRIIQVCSSNFHTLALSASGRVYGWGIGTDTEPYAHAPHLLQELSHLFITQIAVTKAGGGTRHGHSAAVDDSGKLYTWGHNSHNQLGHKSDFDPNLEENYDAHPPALVVGLNSPVEQVKCGEGHTIVLTKDKEVHTFGGHTRSHKIMTDLSPLLLRSGAYVVQVDAGTNSFCAALTNTGTLYTWSHNRGTTEGNFLGYGPGTWNCFNGVPAPVESLRGKIKYFACGWIHAGAVTKDGDLYTWGDGDSNRLGHGSSEYTRHKHQPTPVENMRGAHVTQLSLTRGNEIALTADGDVYVWGSKDHGGHHCFRVPTRLDLASAFLQNLLVREVSCGKFHTTMLSATKMSLKQLCIQYVAKNIMKFPNLKYMLPEELREAIAFYLLDRDKLTPQARWSLDM